MIVVVNILCINYQFLQMYHTVQVNVHLRSLAKDRPHGVVLL